MSVEIANIVHAMCQLEADATPTLGRADGVSAVTRTGAGVFKLVLVEKVNAAQVNVHASFGTIASPGIAVPYWSVDGDGDVVIECRNATVAADPDGMLYVTILRYPTVA